MQIIAHYKGGKLYDVITPTAKYYDIILNTNITECLTIDDGEISQKWGNLSQQELEMAKELINDNNYTDYVSWLKMNKRNEKIDRLLNENSIENSSRDFIYSIFNI